MNFALSTRWNAQRHADGGDMIREILDMGFDRIELGYDLRQELVPGVRAMAEQKPGLIETVHNFCPVPIGILRGHPELWTLADRRPEIRRMAINHTRQTIRFASEVGASAVVLHAGNVKMRRYTSRLIQLLEDGNPRANKYERLKMKLQIKRERKAKKQLDALYDGLSQLLPVLEETHMRLGIENLPSWESFPTEVEMLQLLETFKSPGLGYWHDIGHGQVRQNLGFINSERWLERLQPWLVGMHIHDVAPPAFDHLAPPRGKVDFSILKPFGRLNVFRVFEPAPSETRQDVMSALQHIKNCWEDEPASPAPNTPDNGLQTHNETASKKANEL